MPDDPACRCDELAARVLQLERVVDMGLRDSLTRGTYIAGRNRPLFESLRQEEQQRRSTPPRANPAGGGVPVVGPDGTPPPGWEFWTPTSGPLKGKTQLRRVQGTSGYLPARPDTGVY